MDGEQHIHLEGLRQAMTMEQAIAYALGEAPDEEASDVG